MRSHRSLLGLLAIGAPVALLAGCDFLTGAGGGAPGSGTTSTDLTSVYGGYTLTDEPVAFGDPDVDKVTALEATQTVGADADTIPGDSTLVVRILWGQLDGNPDATTVVDWTGSVAVSAGRLALRRTIAFESPADYILRPRSSPRRIEFVSHTLPHYDGLLLLVHGVDPAPGAETATLTFSTGPYAQTWTLGELVNASLVLPVDDLGNAVAINAMPLPGGVCPRGFARGAWIVRDREQERGGFFGAWLGGDGERAGALRGHFGVNDAGERVWFGKIIGPQGRVLGVARGTWEPSTDPAQPGGRFQGRFVGRPGSHGGEIEGRYMNARRGPDGAGGFFEARWHGDCDGPDDLRP